MDHRRRRDGARADAPIFLHGAWRSGSTFYWSRFRALPQTLCYYEPLHHGLCKLTPERIGRSDELAIAALSHPVQAPYFAEFAPLIDTRGVTHFKRSLAYERFHLKPDEQNPALASYLQSLLSHARSLGRRPVLGFNRSGGRLAWLRQRFLPFDIHIDREPAAIWGSYAAERAGGNYTFFSMWLRILEANQGHPVWAPLAERLKPRGHIGRRLSQTRRDHHRRIDRMTVEETYLLVFYAWLATAPASMAACDLVIDDALVSQPHYTGRIESMVEASTGLQLDLSGAEVRQSRVALDDGLRRRVESEAIALFPRSLSRGRERSGWAAQLSGRKAELIAAIA